LVLLFGTIFEVKKTKKTLTLSIIIPAYNEERYIEKCLDSIKNQTVMPDEVILVDNNCTDKTVELAKHYDFVTIVKELKQGRANARNKGFSVASGDILGRIDVDSNLYPNWVEKVKESFEDDSISAITGLGYTTTTPTIKGKHILESFVTTFWSRMYFWTATAVMRIVVLWGANMAIRSTAWNQIRDKVCNDDELVHEDQDLSLVLAGSGFKAKVIHDLYIRTDGTSYFSWPKFSEYFIRSFKSIQQSKKQGIFNNPDAVRVSWAYSIFVIAICLIPAVAYVLASYLSYEIPKQFFSLIDLIKKR